MKAIPLLLAGLSGLTFAAGPSALETPPKGLASSDWPSIRAAYEAGRHAIRRQDNGTLTARNPGQQWRTEFDGKGFTVTPDHGQWTWGLELTGYGKRVLLSASLSISHEGGKISCQRDENLTEWFINDTRGLEQGWTIREKPIGRSGPECRDAETGFSGSEVGAAGCHTPPLALHLSTRGDLRPIVSPDSSSVSFQTSSGGTALTYGGLKAWDADGTKLTVRFEPAGENQISITVEDQNARYPITIDPVAQQAYLKASNCDADDAFGASVAISGNTVVAGAPFEFSESKSGGVYVFNQVGGVWTEQARLKAPFDAPYFGGSVSVSGDTLVVGCGGVISGSSPSTSVFVFVRQGTAWSLQAQLSPSFINSSDGLGGSVAISGETIVIGATGEDSNATTINGDRTNNMLVDAGAAYVFVRSGSTWTEQAYLKASNSNAYDSFGESVAIYGNAVVVGASGEDSNSNLINGNEANNSANSSGAAYVFVRNGNNWTKQAYLKSSNCGAEDGFGRSVSVSADTIVVGAWWEDSGAINVGGDQLDNSMSNSGAAYVFFRSGAVWTQQAYLKASNTDTDDAFGWSVSVAGNTVVVGAAWPFGGEDSSATGIGGEPMNNAALNSGAAYIFARPATMWTAQSYFKASNSGSGDLFGQAVAIADGIVVVGAYQEDSSITGVNSTPNESASSSGAAYVFDLNAVAPMPEIAVQQVGADIASSTTKAFGSLVVGSTSDLIFTVFNTGNSDLTLSGIPKVTVSGSPDFTVTSQPTSPITGPSGSTTFTLRFAPSSSSSKNAVLSIPNNDADENPFTINLSGSGVTAATAFNNAVSANSSLTGPSALPTAIPFSDGVENLLKYAFNMNFSGPDSRALVSGTGNSGLPAIGLTGTGPATMIRVEFLRRKGSGLVYIPKRSSTLSPGSFVAMGGTPMVTSIDDNWERVVVQESANPSTLPKSFAVVEVELP